MRSHARAQQQNSRRQTADGRQQMVDPPDLRAAAKRMKRQRCTRTMGQHGQQHGDRRKSERETNTGADNGEDVVGSSAKATGCSGSRSQGEPKSLNHQCCREWSLSRGYRLQCPGIARLKLSFKRARCVACTNSAAADDGRDG